MMRTTQVVRLGLLAVCCLMLAGCGTTMRMYPGPARGPNEVAGLELGPDVGIFSVDARSFDVEMVKETELLPGTHSVRAAYFGAPTQRAVVGGGLCLVGGFQSTVPLDLKFEAKAGRTYKLIRSLLPNAESPEGKVEIEDTLTRQIVASATGPARGIAAPLQPVRS